MDAARKGAGLHGSRSGGGVGKFRRLVHLILLVLRAFSGKARTAMHPTWNKSFVIPLGTSLPSPTRHKHKPDLQLLSQPGAMQALTNRIHQRLQVQPTTSTAAPAATAASASSFTCESKGDLLPESVQKLLTSSSWTRASKDIEMINDSLQAYEAFKDYPPHIQKQLCRVGWYQRVEPGRVIFWEGQKPSSFYLILSGSVKAMRKTSGGYDEVIETVKAGQCFGDTAITRRQNRGTTCVASSVAELFIISKSDYIDLSLRQSRLSYQRAKHFAFCKTIALLKHFPLSELESKPDLCLVKYFKPNAVVVKDSKSCDWVYIIMTGSCRVVKRFVNSNEFGRNSLHYYQAGEQHDRKRKVALPNIGEPSHVTGASQTRKKVTAPEDLDDHQIQVQGRKLRHAHTISSLKPSKARQPVHPPVRKQFLVQLQLLHPKDTFGLSSILHTSEPSITLVSNGADIVMISKQFLLDHMSEVIKVKLQRKVMQYPSEEAMRKRIKDHNTWKLFKYSMVHQVKSKQLEYS